MKKRQSLATKLGRTTGLQLILVAGSLSIFSFSVGRHESIQKREALRAKIPAVQVSEQLSKRLSYPTIINELNQSAIADDPQLLNDFDRLSRRFWRQLQSFPVDYINFGKPDGTFLGLGKSVTGAISHNEDSDRFGRGTMFVFSMTSFGSRLDQQEAIPGMSSNHNEPWYVDTVQAREAIWSSIYAWEEQPNTFSISYNAPIFDEKNRLLGVVGVDMIINQLSRWLKDAWENESGLALIVEANGNLVASSQADTTFTGEGSSFRRANISEINNSIIKQLRGAYFQAEDQGKPGIKMSDLSNKPSVLEINNEYYLTTATPWGDNHGLKWFLLTAVRADQEFNTAQRNQTFFLSISLAAILTALMINRRLILGLLTPLTALTSASLNTRQQINAEEIDLDTEDLLSYDCDLTGSSTREVIVLNHAIQSMVEAFNRLTQKIRKQDEQALNVMSSKLKVSLEAASIAHEIKQPLSVVRLTSQSLFEALKRSKGLNIPTALSEGLNTLDHETERISRITERMRALLRNAKTETEPVSLRQIIDSSLRYVQSNQSEGQWIDSSQLQLVPSEESVIEADAIQLQLALINLLKNALEALKTHHTDPDKHPIIRVTLQDQDTHWEINVDDNGPGLPENLLSNQLLNSSKPDGTGLGLFIVSSAAEQHGGHLKLSRSPLGGLRASISLPKPTDPALPNNGD